MDWRTTVGGGSVILGHMVVRNEASRYLAAVLNWHRFLDRLHVYDDHSEDGTVALCRATGAVVSVRPEGVPAFAEHEGRFRQAAWDDFVERVGPSEEDWVVALDADEFFMTNRAGPSLTLPVSNARSLGVTSLSVQIFEVFGWENGVPQVRTDGFWGDLFAQRVFAYRPGGQFKQDNLGCGSCPTYVTEEPTHRSDDVSILHFGYARQEDRLPKYNLYYNDPGNNHGQDHVMSIMGNPKVTPWTGDIPVRE